MKSTIFLQKVLRIKDVAIFTFADLVKLLLIDYIREILLQPEAAEIGG